VNARLVGCLILSLPGVGCGPVRTTLTLSDAEVAIEAAVAADAETWALYDLTAARAYFDKAREEEGYSDFEAATRLAQRSIERAKSARELALAEPRRGELPAGGPPKGLSPKSGPPDEPSESELEDSPADVSGSHL